MVDKVELTPQAMDDLSRLDKTIAQNIANRIDWLSQNIEYIIPVPLKGKFKGKYKLRAGERRIIYSIEHASQSVTIYAVKLRSKVYKI
jgi:mRNA-degrading endonuclease RelE of RelBE toxin-antitoxin system